MTEQILELLGTERAAAISKRIGKAVFLDRVELAAITAKRRKFTGGEKAQAAFGVVSLLQRCGQKPLQSDLDHFGEVNVATKPKPKPKAKPKPAKKSA